MNQRVAYLAVVLGLAGAISVGCGSDDDTSTSHGGTGGTSGHAGSAGKGGSSGHAGSSNESGAAGETSPTGGGGGTEQGGAAGAAGEAGSPGAQGGEGGEAGSGPPHYTQAEIDRGTLIVRSIAQCGGCHTLAATSTTAAGPELGGNATFKGGTLPAPNLTNDATGIGGWTDAQVINAFRNGVDDEGRHLDPIMPYWLFHNMSDEDAKSVVAFLRTVPTPVAATLGETNPDAAALTPLDPAALPNSSLVSTDANYAAAQQGKYLVSGIAQCVKCHSPSSGGLPAVDFFSGVLPATVTSTTIFAPNITPDVTTGIGDWVAADVVKAIRVGTNKLGRTLCGAMASPIKGYAGMTDDDANAIAIYLTTIPAVSKPSTDPDTQNACP